MGIFSRHRAVRMLVGLGVAIVAAGCADVERTVTDLDFLQNERGVIERSVVWESNRYPSHQAHANDSCWEQAVIGAPVPTACLSSRVIFAETDPYNAAPWISFAGTALAIGAFLWFAARRVAWQPTVARQTAGAAAPRSSGTDAAALMRSITQEKSAQRIATGQRRDVDRPAAVGAMIAVAGLVPVVLFLGYGAAMAWAVHTGTVMGFGVGASVLILLIPLPPRPADPDTFSQRVLFFGGATAVLLVGALLAILIHPAMLELNGIAWLG